jgi:hypothetical protein
MRTGLVIVVPFVIVSLLAVVMTAKYYKERDQWKAVVVLLKANNKTCNSLAEKERQNTANCYIEADRAKAVCNVLVAEAERKCSAVNMPAALTATQSGCDPKKCQADRLALEACLTVGHILEARLAQQANAPQNMWGSSAKGKKFKEDLLRALRSMRGSSNEQYQALEECLHGFTPQQCIGLNRLEKAMQSMPPGQIWPP